MKTVKHQIFISYARKDNVGVLPWVSGFRKHLEEYLKVKLADDSFNIWFDKSEIERNYEFDKKMIKGAKESDVFVLILSKNYVASPNCKAEFEAFLPNKVVTKDGFTNLIVVRIEEPNADNRLKEIDKIEGFAFYFKDERNKCRLITEKVKVAEYDYLMRDIADTIEIYLTKVKKEQNSNSQNNDKNKVFIAKVTDDLYEQKEEFKEFLKEEFDVIDADDVVESLNIVKDIKEPMKNSIAVVQLLSKYPAKPTKFNKDGDLKAQKDLANEISKKVFSWCDRDVYENRDKLKEKNKVHYELLNDNIYAGDMEDFKRYIVKEIKLLIEEKNRPQEEIKEDRLRPYVFINASKEDKKLANEISQKLGDFCDIPPIFIDVEDANELNNFIKRHTLECDYYILIYGNAKKTWVSGHLNDYFLYRRERLKNGFEDIKAFVVYKGPPKDKEKVNTIKESGIQVNNLVEIDSQEKIQITPLKTIIGNVS